MKRISTFAAIALATCSLASAQIIERMPVKLQASPLAAPVQAAPVQKEAGELTWLQYCNPNPSVNSIAAIGTASDEIELSAATLFSPTTLAEYTGKKISAAAFMINTPLGATKAFILKGDKINTAETVAEVDVNALLPGWNYIKFPEPVEIDGTVSLAVGFSTKDNGLYPICYDGGKAVNNTSYIKSTGNPYECVDANGWGNLMIRALVEGDPDQLGSNVSLISVNGKRYMPQGEDAIVEATFGNSSLLAANSFTYELTVNEDKSEKTISTGIAPNSTLAEQINLGKLTGNNKISIKLTKVNGEAVEGNTMSINISAYDQTTVVPRTILIEKFTGQSCGNCPSAEANIRKAIKGQEDRVARIDHHYGYGTDSFTILESQNIGKFFGASYAPGCVMDRFEQEDRANLGENGTGIYWHPGYMTSSMVANEIARPAFVTVNIDREYNADTKELKVTVSGKANISVDGARLTVVLTHSNVKARQAGASNFIHNEFPVKYLTSYKGDAVTFAADGSYEKTFTYTIEDGYCPNSNGKNFVTTDVDAMEIVAHLGEWNTRLTSEVLNAAKLKITDKEPGSGIENVYSAANLAFAGGQFTINGSAAGVEVYTLSGMRINNSNLAAGMYIVRAKVNGKAVARKMNVR